MGLFSKKITFDEILKGIESLTDEEKAKLLVKINGEETPEAEAPEDPAVPEAPEAEETPEEGVETPETAPEGEEETATEPVPEVEEGLEQPAEETPAEEPEAEPMNESEQDNTAEMLKSFGDRLTALETTIGELNALKASMEEYVNKQKESFGYRSNGGAGSHKDFQDMSAAELKQHILKN